MTRSFVLLSVWLLAGSVLAADAPVPGLVTEQPKEGPFVKTEKGYMVPYKVEIPGADLSFEMIPIPGGKFKLGSPETEIGRKSDEGPQVEVTVEPFWMAKCEVTWGEYKAFMNVTDVFKGFQTYKMRPLTDDKKLDAISSPSSLYDPSFTFEKGDSPSQPAVTMSQFAAKQYTKWLSLLTGPMYRLPSEAEWEYAARGGSNAAYSFGNDPNQLGEYGWFKGNSEETTHEVGQKKPNAYGLHDMHGNVAEWVLDEYQPTGYQKLVGKNPTGVTSIAWPTKLFPRVFRGGSFVTDAALCRAASRRGSNDIEWYETDPNEPKSPWWFSDGPSLAIGFRIIRPLNPPSREEMSKFWEADLKQIKEDATSRISQGRGAAGYVDPSLPEATKELRKAQRNRK